MQRHLFRSLAAMLACELMCSTPPEAAAQTPWPSLCLQDVEWTDGTHHTAVTQPITAPCSPGSPVAITDEADAEFVSGTSVHLADGFHAYDFAEDGLFHAYIDEALDAPADLVLITPDPTTHIVDDIVHVNKWEKLEIGLRLPEEYQAAVNSFFAHYYSNGVYQYATVDSLERDHDLNPYADDSLQLVMTLTSPTGQQRMKWGFFMKETKWTTGSHAYLTENLSSPMYPYHIRFRFAPDEEGLWQFTLDLKAPYTTTPSGTALPTYHYTGYAFTCDPPFEDNHGFLHVNPANRRTLQFDDSTAFFGLGTNVAHPPGGHDIGSVYYSHFHQHGFDQMVKTMDQLHAVGGNFLRMWQGARTFAPEYINLGVYDRYHALCPCPGGSWPPLYNSTCQGQCWALDSILVRARADDLYIQLTTENDHPAIGGENDGWGSHPYVTQFLEPSTNAPPYDVKRFFFTDGNPDSTDSGVFYYWKRKYKYMMARWGYSVNLAVIEPFNETDQTLSYHERTFMLNDDNGICQDNYGTWPADSLLPYTMDQWLTKLMAYVRGPVNLSDPVGSSLGEDKKLFLMSYTGGQPPGNSAFYYSCANPGLDLIDMHRYNNAQEDLKNSADVAETYRATYDKPFHQGEFLTWGDKPVVLAPDSIVNMGTWKYFHNYDVSFHNEIWASTFFGSFANASSWGWDRIYWYPGAVPTLPDGDNPHQTEFYNVLDSTNILNVTGVPEGYPLVNKPIHHNFKPMAELLNNPNWQSYGFFNEDFTPSCKYDTISGLECYYLVNEAGSLAIGWVHNTNAYWENHFYMNSATQNFLGCVPPNADSIALPGFAQEHDYVVTYFPTRMNETPPPADTVTSTLAGFVTLDLSDTLSAFGGTANNYLDTLHADYAFIIAPEMIMRSMLAHEEADSVAIKTDWDFTLYPNPANDRVNLMLPQDGFSSDVFLFDISGKQVYYRQNVSVRTPGIPVAGLSKGTYCVRVSRADSQKMKILIIN